MHNIWVLDLLSQPAQVVAHVSSRGQGTIRRAAELLSVVYHGPQYTIVHMVNAEPLGIPEPEPVNV